MTEDTIAALSTPPGEGGIAIVRVSGSLSFFVVEQLFNSSKTNSQFENRKMYHGYITAPGSDDIIDEVLVVFMKAPHTYTCEDVVEIHCHGGMIPVREILQTLFSHGVRPAEPGEFTKRAFLNGRLDLTQAESVMDLITSQTKNLKKVAVEQLQGRLKSQIQDLREQLLTIMAHLEAKIDFPDEDINVASSEELQNLVNDAKDQLRNLIDSYDKGKIIREGVKTVIVGRPNVGKSSLLNLLLGEDRAIVTEIPGTTRDILEETINLQGIPLRIIDTAGIRESSDRIEQIGVERTKKSMEQGDIILVVLDSSQELTDNDRDLLEMAKGKNALIVLNKTDLDEQLDTSTVEKLVDDPERVVKISALREQGLDKLEQAVTNLVFGGSVKQSEELVVTNARHYNSLEKAKYALDSGEASLMEQMSEDLVAIDIKEAYDKLGDITGDSASEDLIENIFSNFCIGK